MLFYKSMNTFKVKVHEYKNVGEVVMNDRYCMVNNLPFLFVWYSVDIFSYTYIGSLTG